MAHDATNVVAEPRTILTHDGSDGVPFQWADLGTTQIGDLNTGPTGIPDGLGSARVDYLRGSRAPVEEHFVQFRRRRFLREALTSNLQEASWLAGPS